MRTGRDRRPPRRPPRKDFEEGDPKERQAKLFVSDLETRVKYFMAGEDQELELEPMNSYKRRLVHQVAKDFQLETDSRGEEPNRFVCLIKTKDSKTPADRGPKARLWDFGSQTFPVNPGSDGVRLALKVDGSIELVLDGKTHNILDEQLVTSKEIRIRKGKIVQPGEPNW